MWIHGPSWVFMGLHGSSWVFMGLHGSSWGFMGLHGSSCDILWFFLFFSFFLNIDMFNIFCFEKCLDWRVQVWIQNLWALQPMFFQNKLDLSVQRFWNSRSTPYFYFKVFHGLSSPVLSILNSFMGSPAQSSLFQNFIGSPAQSSLF